MQKSALASLNGLLQREFKYEMENYKVDKRCANLLCEMGYLLGDNSNVSNNQFQKLIKRTDSHLIVITYELRKRLVCPPTPSKNPEFIQRLSP